jgi:hypothetical protein
VGERTTGRSMLAAQHKQTGAFPFSPSRVLTVDAALHRDAHAAAEGAVALVHIRVEVAWSLVGGGRDR